MESHAFGAKDAPMAQDQPGHGSMMSEVLSSGSDAVHKVAQFVHDRPLLSSTVALAGTGLLLYATRGKWSSLSGAAEEAAIGTTEAGLGAEKALTTSSFTAKALKFSPALPVLALGSLLLTGCEEDKKEEAHVYENPQQCIQEGVFSEKFCTDEFQQAQQLHDEAVPKFQKKDDCESSTGMACVATDTPPLDANGQPMPVAGGGGGNNWFMPYMMGYMIGSNNTSTYYATGSDQAHGGGGTFIARPLYGRPGQISGSSRPFVTEEGETVATAPGRVQVPVRTLAEPPMRTAAFGAAADDDVAGGTRGGFGGRAGGFGDGAG